MTPDRRSYAPDPDDRSPHRQPPADCVPGRLTWRDAAGRTRFVSVDHAGRQRRGRVRRMPGTRPRFRCIGWCISRWNAPARDMRELPGSRCERARCSRRVYRVGPYKSATGTPQGYALRLLVEPSGQPRVTSADRWRSRTESGSPQHSIQPAARLLPAFLRQYRARPSHSRWNGAAVSYAASCTLPHRPTQLRRRSSANRAARSSSVPARGPGVAHQRGRDFEVVEQAGEVRPHVA